MPFATGSAHQLGRSARLAQARKWGAALAVIASAAVAFAPLGTGATATGCATHSCDSSSRDYYGGFMLDSDTFVTNDIYAPWLEYGGNETIRIWFPKEVAGRTPKIPVGELGIDPTPNGGAFFMGGGNYTLASGQLAYYNFLDTRLQTTDAGTFAGGFWATNATCTSYFVRFEVDFLPIDAGTAAANDAAVDAQSGAEGAVNDGGAADVAPSDGETGGPFDGPSGG